MTPRVEAADRHFSLVTFHVVLLVLLEIVMDNFPRHFVPTHLVGRFKQKEEEKTRFSTFFALPTAAKQQAKKLHRASRFVTFSISLEKGKKRKKNELHN